MKKQIEIINRRLKIISRATIAGFALLSAAGGAGVFYFRNNPPTTAECSDKGTCIECKISPACDIACVKQIEALLKKSGKPLCQPTPEQNQSLPPKGA